jgi:hypothetical protein
VPNFTVVNRTEVGVLNPDGRVQRQRVPEGVSPATFRNVLSAVDVYWNSEGRMPTPHEARKVWPNLSLKTYQAVFSTPEFREGLERRGITMDAAQGLTELQMAALTLLSNPTDVRTTSAKLKDLGVPPTQYRAWMRNPLFATKLRERSEHNLGDAIPTAINRLIGNVESGDPRSIEFLLKMSGRYDPAAVEVENARVVVLTLVEAILSEVKDPDVRERILAKADDKMRAIQVKESLKEIR